MLTPYSYQIPHIQNLVKTLTLKNAALDGSDLGTGKTICALLTAQELGLDVSVVTRKSIIPVWERWLDEAGDIDGEVINYEQARKRGLKIFSDTLYIFDEVHNCKGEKTENSKLLLATYMAGVPILMLSGTVSSNPLDLFSVGQIIGIHKGSDWYRFLYNHGVRRNRYFRGFHFDGKLKHLEKIHKHLYPEWGSRMRITDIPEFPQTKIIAEARDCAPYDEPKLKPYIWEIYATKQEEGEDPFEGEASGLVENLYARMEAEVRKVPVFIDEIEEALNAGNSVAVFLNFRITMQAIEGLLKRKCAKIFGAQRPEDREKARTSFQEDKVRLILVMMEAGGQGLDLHDVRGIYPRVSLLSPSYKAIDLQQALGRIHRAGTKSKSVQKIIFDANTIEKEVCKNLARKLDSIDTINDNDLRPPIEGLPKYDMCRSE